MSESALYEGRIRHRRFGPVEHEFEYPIFMAYLDLAELPDVLEPLPLWSARRPALARFRRDDHLGDTGRPLAECVSDLVAAETARPEGPIRTLTNLRYFGHCFNPVSFHFCFDPDGERVDAVLADVSNTPWGERHAYVIGNEEGSRVVRGRIEKNFHVSPMIGMDHVYEWSTSVPGERMQVHIESRETQSGQERKVFDATLSMRRRELSPANARRMLARYPATTAHLVARIYWQALRLRLKGAPWYPHPEQTS